MPCRDKKTNLHTLVYTQQIWHQYKHEPAAGAAKYRSFTRNDISLKIADGLSDPRRVRRGQVQPGVDHPSPASIILYI